MSLGADAVFRDLQGLGFTVKAGLFSALETGASQIRRRLFIVAHADKVPLLQSDRTGVGRSLVSTSRGTEANRGAVRSWEGNAALDPDLAPDASLRGAADETFQLPIFPPAPSQFERWAEILGRRPDLQPELFGLDHGVADRVDRSDAAGNGVVSLAAAYAWRTLKAAHHDGRHAR
jgi:DNA (cytosine-5)-methyltransferase 1